MSKCRPSCNQLDLALGEQLRDAGIHRVLEEKGSESAQEEITAWKESFYEQARILLRSQGSITAEEVVGWVGYPPGHRNAIGAAMRTFAMRHRLVRAAFERAIRPTRHAGTVVRWKRAEDSL
jgi:hypothetical protein